MAKAYRFHNVVALNVQGATVYLPAPDAARLGQALARASRSILKGESFGESDCNGPDVADFGFPPDAHNVADALASGRVRVREIKPGQWRGLYRDKGGRFRAVASQYGPIDYRTPRDALTAATYESSN